MRHFIVNKGYAETAAHSSLILTHVKGFKTRQDARDDLIATFEKMHRDVNAGIQKEIDYRASCAKELGRTNTWDKALDRAARRFQKKSLTDFVKWFFDADCQAPDSNEAWEALTRYGWDFYHVKTKPVKFGLIESFIYSVSDYEWNKNR